MNLLVNGELREVPDRTSVATLVESVTTSPRGIAVARNGDVIPRSRWSDVLLDTDDRVEILDAAQGG